MAVTFVWRASSFPGMVTSVACLMAVVSCLIAVASSLIAVVSSWMAVAVVWTPAMSERICCVAVPSCVPRLGVPAAGTPRFIPIPTCCAASRVSAVVKAEPLLIVTVVTTL